MNVWGTDLLPWQVHSSGARGYIPKEILAKNQLASFPELLRGILGNLLKIEKVMRKSSVLPFAQS